MKYIIVLMMLATCFEVQAQTEWVGTQVTSVERPFSKSDMPKTIWLYDNVL